MAAFRAPLLPSAAAALAAVAVSVLAAWHFQLRAMDVRAAEYSTGLKKLLLSKQLPPTDELMQYLNQRQQALDGMLRQRLSAVAVSAPVSEASANPQLYFQERLHAVERTVERLAAARNMGMPEWLGLPKELPPAESVPRLLAQLDLIEEASVIILEQSVASIASFKVEDPEAVLPAEPDAAAFLTRLPLRMRMDASLPQLVKLLNALARAHPVMDIRAIRIVPKAAAAPAGSPAGGLLDVELLLARYMADPGAKEITAEEPKKNTGTENRRRSRPGNGRQGDESS